ncbi:hypothetical protein BN2476_830037 [Paraburkholderia piptadeniae]|uniref:Uncharacterized protein n=1 Tax=Paraburkholderia piptadeniae TaxID=1701573 RepID=A0A1N7ST25_9BURK|nr:hypothetical protein [Paraburkholderia piptadeniae]SIT50466.1 hypothetical protein BN2476_830037 [Paraburkholderia piptadeniae]
MSDAATNATTAAPADTEVVETPLMKRLKAEIKEFEFAPIHILEKIEAIARNHFGIAPAA